MKNLKLKSFNEVNVLRFSWKLFKTGSLRSGDLDRDSNFMVIGGLTKEG